MRQFFLVALIGLWGCHGLAHGGNAQKPNVIVFLCDDVGYGEFGFQGNKEIPTPHIDSIARDGVRFTSGYVAATYCSPCRAGLLTGRYPTRFGHEFNGGGPKGLNGNFGLSLNETTIAQRLKGLGYATACVGKWHLGNRPQYQAVDRGFDEFYGTVANTPFFNPPNFIDSRKSREITAIKDSSFYSTDAYASRAVEWIGSQKDKPFFLYFAFNAQHAPLQAPKKYLDRFPEVKEEKRKIFCAMMSAMDDAVGKVLEQVKAMEQEQNTLIFFLSDNGGPTRATTSKNGPLRGFKMTTLEGGTRVPFVMSWKGKVPGGKVYDQPILNLDILPTAVAAAGGTIDPAWKLDGVDLVPYLKGETSKPPHSTLYWRFGKQWAIRHGDWKLGANNLDGVDQPRLFHLKEDIGETRDLTRDHPEKVAELKSLWDAWNKEQAPASWPPG